MARQAILTTYFGPGNSRGSRVQAKADAGTKYYPWDHALDSQENHRAAAIAFATELEWIGEDLSFGEEDLIAGAMPQSSKEAYCWVFDDREHKSSATGDWRDAAIDAILEERYDQALLMISEAHRGSASSIITNQDGIPEWSLRDSIVFLCDGEPAFEVTAPGQLGSTSRRQFLRPTQLGDLRERILDALNAGLI